MPLASKKDKIIQIKWGIADFAHHFGRYPEGMWLAETAADIETLEVLAGEGITFTILAPWQSSRWRAIDPITTAWQPGIDPRYPYICHLPSGQQIVLFFYNGKLAGDIAFGQLLNDGKNMADAFRAVFDKENLEPQLAHIATDGETFGHHHRFGEMALAYCLHEMERDSEISLLPYGAFIGKYPILREVEIVPGSSWSCVHGVERWRSDCGCKTGGEPHWKQAWRTPLRGALDGLKIKLDQWYDEQMRQLIPRSNPNEILLTYGSLLPHRSDHLMQNFAQELELHIAKDQHQLFRLLEMQRNGQLMFTSCAWFFNDLSGIETTQVLQYACRAIQLMTLSGGDDLTNGFLDSLVEAKSNIPEEGNGADIYRKAVLSEEMTMERVAVFMAAQHMMYESKSPSIWNYQGKYLDWKKHTRATAQMEYGTLAIHSSTTLAEESLHVLVVYAGGLKLFGFAANMKEGSVFPYDIGYLLHLFDNEQWEELKAHINTIRGVHTFVFSDLLHDEQAMLAANWLNKEPGENTEHLFGFSTADLVYLHSSVIPIPMTVKHKVGIQLLRKIRKCLQMPYHHQNNQTLEELLGEYKRWDLALPTEDIILDWKSYFEGMQKIAFSTEEEHILGLVRLLNVGKTFELMPDTSSLVLRFRNWISDGSNRLPEHGAWRALMQFLDISPEFYWGNR